MFAVGQGGLNCARQQHIKIISTVIITVVTLITIIAISIVIGTIIITTTIIDKLVFFSQLLMVEGIDLDTRDGMGLTLEEVAR